VAKFPHPPPPKGGGNMRRISAVGEATNWRHGTDSEPLEAMMGGWEVTVEVLR